MKEELNVPKADTVAETVEGVPVELQLEEPDRDGVRDATDSE